jgi:hypothetical protein
MEQVYSWPGLTEKLWKEEVVVRASSGKRAKIKAPFFVAQQRYMGAADEESS